MTPSPETTPTPESATKETPSAGAVGTRVSRRQIPRRAIGAGALVAAALIGAGAATVVETSSTPSMVMLNPAPIARMADWSPVAIKGNVAEIFGNKFIVQDDSGRALVDTGPAGEGSGLVAASETIIVQGRFENGVVHAAAIQHADGHSDLVGPPGPPRRRGPVAWLRDHWHRLHWMRAMNEGRPASAG